MRPKAHFGNPAQPSCDALQLMCAGRVFLGAPPPSARAVQTAAMSLPVHLQLLSSFSSRCCLPPPVDSATWLLYCGQLLMRIPALPVARCPGLSHQMSLASPAPANLPPATACGWFNATVQFHNLLMSGVIAPLFPCSVFAHSQRVSQHWH